MSYIETVSLIQTVDRETEISSLDSKIISGFSRLERIVVILFFRLIFMPFRNQLAHTFSNIPQLNSGIEYRLYDIVKVKFLDI